MTLIDAVPVFKAFYGQGSGPIIINSLECTGVENNILECAFDSDTSNCSHSDDAGVQCTILDTTPPRLQFLTAPRLSNQNITIIWAYDEAATSFCTLLASTILTAVACENNSVALTNLAEGFYSLFVQGTDLANNTAAPVQHSWTVGKCI